MRHKSNNFDILSIVLIISVFITLFASVRLIDKTITRLIDEKVAFFITIVIVLLSLVCVCKRSESANKRCIKVDYSLPNVRFIIFSVGLPICAFMCTCFLSLIQGKKMVELSSYKAISNFWIFKMFLFSFWEEFIFRKNIFVRLTLISNKRVAIWISSIGFGLMHLNLAKNVSVLFLFFRIAEVIAFGILLCYLLDTTESILLCTLLHFTWNVLFSIVGLRDCMFWVLFCSICFILWGIYYLGMHQRCDNEQVR